jgi:hypothetical protein
MKIFKAMIKHTSKLQTIIIFPVIFSLLFLYSCKEEFSMSYDSTYTRLIVDGSMTTDTVRHYVRLTRSGDALNQNPAVPITGAVVSISDGDTSFLLHPVPKMDGLYATDSTVFGIPGKTYTLNISNVDVNNDDVMETYTAKSILKKENSIDTIRISYLSSNPHMKGWVINMTAKDNGGGRNFYLMKAYKNDTLLTDSIQEYMNIADNSGFEGKYYYNFPVYFLSQQKKDEIIHKGDTITLEMDGITEEYYRFILDFIQEYYPKLPIFSGPSANIATNIEPKEKAMGFFAVYSIQRKTIIY